MQKFPSLAAIAILFAGGAARAQSVEGVWRTEPSTSGPYEGAYLDVRVGPCEGAAERVCGAIADVYETDREEVIGRAVLWDMTPDGPGRWTGGRIWVPTRDVVVDATMALEGGSLVVEGCLALVCESQTWTRVQ